MRLPGFVSHWARRGLGAVVVIALAGCRGNTPYVVPEGPMPSNTVMLSQMMRELSAKPGFTEAMLAQLDKDSRQGPALLTPKLAEQMRKVILGKDWQGLDRFPGWTMRAINPTVQVVAKVAGKNSGAAALSAYVDVGAYGLDKSETVSLDEPSTLPGFTTDGIVVEMGDGVTRGDGANPDLAPMHAESQRLADALNRVSLNGVEGIDPISVTILGHAAKSPEELVGALTASGHKVEVYDARYFANFGHFNYKGQDVMMPFWVNTQIQIPGTKRSLLVPVSHAEYEWRVRGPKVNADVSWYFGIDGKAQFRTMDTLDQAWVMGRHAHVYQGADAVEVTRLAGRMVVAYAHQHQARPELPFGGYYALGVCQDSIAAIERKMTGKVTLFPNTADAALFDDARDAEVNALIAAIPKDRTGAPPDAERVFGSLPTEDVDEISIPGLADDLASVQTAWEGGTLQRTYGPQHRIVIWLEVLGALLAAAVALMLRYRRR